MSETNPSNATSGKGRDEGIRFSCPPERLPRIEAEMAAYMAALGIAPGLVRRKAERGAVVYSLNADGDSSGTLSFRQRPELQIRDSTLHLPTGQGTERTMRTVHTVSKKEILLALLQQGRLTEFNSAECSIAALIEHIGIRQNTVAWAESVEWGWPDGGPAKWNVRYWHKGTPRPGIPLHEAIDDIYIHPDRYAMGCYTATKVAMIQGVLDYYRRVNPNPARLELVQNRLATDREPLYGVEPGRMWDFEVDYAARDPAHPGKLLKIESGVAANNFVPGDWVYFLNTDPRSKQKTGFEGSSAIYLGRNKFSDYYNDNHHAYTYQQKLDEVYQWRNGVFSRRHDWRKIVPLAAQDFERLSRTPSEGGLLVDLRVFPYFFGHEKLPALVALAPNP